MARLPLTLIALLGLAACTPGSVITATADGDSADDDTGTPPDDTDTDDDSATDTGDDDTDTGSEPTDADGDGYVAEPEYDCDDSDAAVNPGATEVCDDVDNDCDGYIDENGVCDVEEDESQLEITIMTPGDNVYGSVMCHVEYVEDDLATRLSDNAWGSWEYSWVENWVSETTLESDPGVIEGVRLNCTLCPDELTLAEEPSGSTAESMGCTWTGYGSTSSQSRVNGAVATWYFDETFSAEPLYISGGTSVLVDFR